MATPLLMTVVSFLVMHNAHVLDYCEPLAPELPALLTLIKAW